MPGLLLCFVMRFDAYKKAHSCTADATVQPGHLHKVTCVRLPARYL